ncbi:MAG: glycosyltransferase [Vicinamibacterales bacterium]|nr:glycosyltransferase [Vicinamibacterales bacterium]
MRIVQAVGWYLPDSLGGTELYVAALAAWLQRAGHDVHVAAPDAAQAGERRYEYAGVPVYRYPIPSRATRDEARGRTPVRGAERFHRWLEALTPDIVHVHTFVTGLGLAEIEAAQATGARVIVTSHSASLGFVCERGTMLRLGRALCDGLTEPVKCAACALEARHVPEPLADALARIPGPLSRAARRWPGGAGTALAMRALIDGNIDRQRRLFAHADAVVVLSDWAAAVLRANGAPADRVVVNRLGIDAARPGASTRKPGPDARPTETPVTIGFVGRAEAIKGLDDAVRAVASLPANLPIRLRAIVVASTDADRAELDRCRQLASGDPRIAFEPAVSPGQVPALLSSLDLLVCPSRAVEGGPTVALEAHAAGTPVVGTAMPALTEIVTDGVNGRLVPPGDWRALARVLLDAASNPPESIDRWRAALPAPRTTDLIAREYLELYTRVR